MTNPNERIIGGQCQRRLFAYLHKKDHTRFGLLEAADSRDARNHLGSTYHIRQTWLTIDEHHGQMFDRDRKWEIVSSIFLNPLSAAFIGKQRTNA